MPGIAVQDLRNPCSGSRNQRSGCPESPFTFGRNRRSRCSGIRTKGNAGPQNTRSPGSPWCSRPAPPAHHSARASTEGRRSPCRDPPGGPSPAPRQKPLQLVVPRLEPRIVPPPRPRRSLRRDGLQNACVVDTLRHGVFLTGATCAGSSSRSAGGPRIGTSLPRIRPPPPARHAQRPRRIPPDPGSAGALPKRPRLCARSRPHRRRRLLAPPDGYWRRRDAATERSLVRAGVKTGAGRCGRGPGGRRGRG
jgi:hypothetical protein